MDIRHKERADKLTNEFIQHQISSAVTEDLSDICHNYLKLLGKLLEEMRVWPPTLDILITEITLVHNHLLICVAVKMCRIRQSTQYQTEQMIYLTLQRVLQFVNKASLVGSPTDVKEISIEKSAQLISEALKDPLKHFRLRDLLGQILLLFSLCCIYRKEQDNQQRGSNILVIFDHIIKTVGELPFQEQLPHKNYLLLCTRGKAEKEQYMYVGDTMRLVLSSCHLTTTQQGCLKSKQRQWLLTLFHCQEMMERGEYAAAMEILNLQLEESLDPEPKSKLLCQFAQCYLHLNCPQLAIQTYKTALRVYEGHAQVFFYLAEVYRILGMTDLELETLNLLVKLLTDKSTRLKPQQFTTDIDILIMSTWKVQPDITLPSALHHFAKRCFHLFRYKEASEQYLSLLQWLEDIKIHTGIDESVLDVNIQQLVVETAEALVLAQRHSDCITFCDQFISVFTIDDSFVHLSQECSLESFHGRSLNKRNSNSSLSQASLFSQSQNSIFDNETRSPHKDSITHKKCSQSHLKSSCLQQLHRLSRKRARSSSVESDDKNEWWSKSLTVRLLLSKADALVVTQSFSDDTVSCLKKAYDILVDSEATVFKPDVNTDLPTQPPPKKHKYLDPHMLVDSETTVFKPDVNTDLPTQPPPKKHKCLDPHPVPDVLDISAEDKRPGRPLEGSLGCLASPVWATAMVNVCMRMARASFKRHQFLSVLNLCQLILQLEPNNVHAHYMKTKVLRDQPGCEKSEVSRQWLLKRGIDSAASKAILTSVMEEKQNQMKEKQEERDQKKMWWKVSDIQLLSLDVACITDIVPSAQEGF